MITKSSNNINSKTKVLFFPRKILVAYLFITLIMFIISPWQWPLQNPIIFYGLNLGYLLAFYIGYNWGVINYRKKRGSIKLNVNKIINYSLILNIIFIYPKFLFKLKVPAIGISELINSIVLGIFNPSIAYAAKHQSDYQGFLTLSNPLVLSYFLLLPILYFIIPLGIFYWKTLRPWQKLTYLVIVFSDILSYLAIGTNKGIFDYIILIPVVIVASNPSLIHLKRLTKKRLKYIAVSTFILLLGIMYFTRGNKGRKQDFFNYDTSIESYVNKNAVILNFIPDSFEDSYIALDNYLTQGYYAMGLSLNLNHQFTYGVGHNSFATILAEKVLGDQYIQNKTYQSRIEEAYGYSSTGKWHSIYVWIANDLTFYGVIVFVFYVSYFLSQIWIDAINFRNPFAVILLPLFFIMIFYFSANNQVLGNQGSSTVFWIYFFMWLNTRGRRIIIIDK